MPGVKVVRDGDGIQGGRSQRTQEPERGCARHQGRSGPYRRSHRTRTSSTTWGLDLESGGGGRGGRGGANAEADTTGPSRASSRRHLGLAQSYTPCVHRARAAGAPRRRRTVGLEPASWTVWTGMQRPFGVKDELVAWPSTLTPPRSASSSPTWAPVTEASTGDACRRGRGASPW